MPRFVSTPPTPMRNNVRESARRTARNAQLPNVTRVAMMFCLRKARADAAANNRAWSRAATLMRVLTCRHPGEQSAAFRLAVAPDRHPDDHVASRHPFEVELRDFGAEPSLCY